MNKKYWVLLIVISFFSCRKNLEEVSWDTDILTPIAFANLSPQNLTKSEDEVIYNSEGLVSLAFDHPLFSYNPLDTLKLDVDPFSRELTLESLELANQNFSERFLFGKLITDQGLQSTLPNNALVFPALINLVPPINISDPIKLDVSNYFEYAILSQGRLNININNQFPVNIDNLSFEVRNASAGTLLYSKSFNNIPSRSSVSDNTDLYAILGNTPIEGVLEVKVTNLTISAAGSGFIKINYQDYVNFAVTLSDLKVESAKAIFPSQNVIDHTDEVVLQNMGEIELKSAQIDSGYVRVKVKSSIETALFINYSISSASIGNAPFSLQQVVPAAPTGGDIFVDKKFPVKNFNFDFSGNDGTKTNTFVNRIVGQIKPTASPVLVTLGDTIFVEISVVDLTTSQVSGYIGKMAFKFGPEKINFDLLDGMQFSLLNFKDAKASLKIANGIGITGNGNMNLFTATNTYTTNTYSTSLIPNVAIKSAGGNMTNPKIVNSFINLPNAANLVNINPNELEYDVDFELNTNGNNPAHSNFANKNYPVQGLFHLELPLNVQIENLELVDTFAFVSEDLAIIDNINTSTLIINIANDFPLTAKTKLYFLDQNNVEIDSLILPKSIAAATIGANDKTISPALYRYEEKISTPRLNKLLNSNSIRAVINFNSRPNNQHVKFFKDYLFKVRISSDINLTVQNKL